MYSLIFKVLFFYRKNISVDKLIWKGNKMNNKNLVIDERYKNNNLSNPLGLNTKNNKIIPP